MNYKLLPVFFTLLRGFAQTAQSNGYVCELRSGCLGTLQIGQSRADLEKHLGRRLSLEFAGDGRAGVSIVGRAEIDKLGIASAMDVMVKDVDIFLSIRPKSESIEMISMRLACADVDKLRSRLAKDGVATTVNNGNGWRLEDSKSKFYFGAEKQPVCRFWLRANTREGKKVPGSN